MADSLILTTAGLAKLAIASPESPVQISHLAVGDGGGGYPALSPSWTALANEVWRGTASEPIREPGNPTVLKFETVIPSEDGGFFIRELGLFDSTGTLIAVAQCSVVEKPGALSSTALTMTVAMRLTLANASQTQVVVSDTPYIDHGGLSGRSTANAHPISAITGLQTALDGKVSSGDSRLSNAREWTASEVSQSEAEAGTAATPRKWTAQRVRQAIAAAFTSLGHSALGGRNDANAHPMAAISGLTGKQDFNATEGLNLPATIAGAVSLKSTAYNMRAILPKVADLPRAVEVTLYLSHDSTHPVMVRASTGDTLNMPDDVKYDSVPGEIILRPTGGWVTLRSIAGTGWEVVASNIHLRDPNEFKRGMPLVATKAEILAGEDYSKMLTPDGLAFAQGPYVSGFATLTATDNKIAMTGVVAGIKLEKGDVVRVIAGAHNKLHTAESLPNNNEITVNYEHCGSRGNGALKLPNYSGSVTIIRVAKWYEASLGVGQAWVDLTSLRTVGALNTNTTGRTIGVFIDAHDSADSRANIQINSYSWASGNPGGAEIGSLIPFSIIVPHDSAYSVGGSNAIGWRKFLELR